MDDCKFRMVEMMHLYLSGAITDEEMQELQKVGCGTGEPGHV